MTSTIPDKRFKEPRGHERPSRGFGVVTSHNLPRGSQIYAQFASILAPAFKCGGYFCDMGDVLAYAKKNSLVLLDSIPVSRFSVDGADVV